MEALYLSTNKERKRFLSFQERLYRGDPCYVDTASFCLEDVLFQKTPFTKSCRVQPIMIVEGKRELAQAVFVYHSALPYLQVSFFEALEGERDGVNFLLMHAKQVAKSWGRAQIVIGLNAHISYGVGILTDGFSYRNSFDSIYNKSYYKDYFKGLPSQGLSTYRAEKSLADTNLLPLPKGCEYHIEYGDKKRLKETCERMRLLCEKTIAKTFLYFPTEKYHFYYLMKDLAPFLRDENFLFAVDAKGEDKGFLFWHPDYNQMLGAGEKTSAFKIIKGYLCNRKKINRAKLNAIGSLTPQVTLLLLSSFSRLVEGVYPIVETNFVWDNNLPSTAINRRFFGLPHRKYEVYFINAD